YGFAAYIVSLPCPHPIVYPVTPAHFTLKWTLLFPYVRPMISSTLSAALTPVNLAPFWLTSAVVTFSENIRPPWSEPKMRTVNASGFLASRRLPIYPDSLGCVWYWRIRHFIQIICQC